MKLTNGMTMSVEDWINELSFEVNLTSDDEFLKIKETLTRIGIPSNASFLNDVDQRELYQSCHIFQKRGKYYIVHFKELLLLDGKKVNLSDEDITRRDIIINLLYSWGMIDVVSEKVDHLETIKDIKLPLKIIPFRDKGNWTLIPKYQIGSDNKRG